MSIIVIVNFEQNVRRRQFKVSGGTVGIIRQRKYCYFERIEVIFEIIIIKP